MIDRRVYCTELATGYDHPTLEDTVNRMIMVEHNMDGSHKTGTMVSGYASLTEAKNAFPAAKTTLVIDADTTISGATVIPTNISLVFSNGAKITTTGGSLTINGAFNAPLSQVFTGTGTVTFGPGVVTEVYPQWFGAVPDGVNDTTPYIQKALDSLPCATGESPTPSYAVGGTVKLSRGNWAIETTLVINSMQRLIGEGYSTVLVHSAAGAAINIGTGSGFVEMCELRDFAILGDDTASAGKFGIYGRRVLRSKITNLYITKMGDSGIWLHGASYTYIEGCYIRTNRGHGILLEGSHIDQDGYHCTDTYLLNNTIRENSLSGIFAYYSVSALTVRDNAIESNGSAQTEQLGEAGGAGGTAYYYPHVLQINMHLNSVIDSVFDNNYFEQAGTAGAPNIQVAMYGGYHNTFTNNVMANQVGLLLWGANSNTPTLNKFINCRLNSNITSVLELSGNVVTAFDAITPGVTPNANVFIDCVGARYSFQSGHMTDNSIVHSELADSLVHGVTEYTTTSATTYTPDAGVVNADSILTGQAKGKIYQITLAHNISSVGLPTDIATGTIVHFHFIQNGTGGFTVTFSSAYVHAWSNTGNTANKQSTISFYYKGSNKMIQLGAQSPYM